MAGKLLIFSLIAPKNNQDCTLRLFLVRLHKAFTTESIFIKILCVRLPFLELNKKAGNQEMSEVKNPSNTLAYRFIERKSIVATRIGVVKTSSNFIDNCLFVTHSMNAYTNAPPALHHAY